MALLIITATGFRSLAWASNPRRCASSGIEPPPAKGSSRAGGLPPVDFMISALAWLRISSLLVFSHFTSFSIKLNRRRRSASCSFSVGNCSGLEEGSSTSEEKMTARAVAKGRLAHHRCSVDGCPWRMDFSRADAALIASRGSATSISFFL